MLRTSVFLMTMMVMAASASAQGAEVSGTVGWTFSEGVSGNAVLVPGVGTFDRIDPKDAWAWGVRVGFFAGANSEIGFLYNQQPTDLEVGGTTTVKLGDIKLHNYHGYYAFNFGGAEATARPYLLFGLGGTQYGGGQRHRGERAAGNSRGNAILVDRCGRLENLSGEGVRNPPRGAMDPDLHQVGGRRLVVRSVLRLLRRGRRTVCEPVRAGRRDLLSILVMPLSDRVQVQEKRISNDGKSSVFRRHLQSGHPGHAPRARAQQVDQWTAIQQLQADLKADRQAVVAANLPLTEGEARAFWPAYKEYRVEVEKLGDRMVKLIAAYAANFETMTDAKADEFFNDLLAIDRDRLAVREKYVPKIRAVLPGQKAARFFQIENKLDAIVNVSLASEIPLVPVKR